MKKHELEEKMEKFKEDLKKTTKEFQENNEKLKENNEKIEEKIKQLDEKYNLMLMFNKQITYLCLQDIQQEQLYTINKGGDTEKEQLDYYFKFNVHAFTVFFAKYFSEKYGDNDLQNIPTDENFLEKWNTHIIDTLNPLFKQEKQKIIDKYEKRKTPPQYIR